MASPVIDVYVRSASGDVAGGRNLVAPGLTTLLIDLGHGDGDDRRLICRDPSPW